MDIFEKYMGKKKHGPDELKAYLNENISSAGVLTGYMINKMVEMGGIKITDFDKNNINPNSYNLAIGNKMKVYSGIKVIDLHNPKTYGKTMEFEFPDREGLLLRPGNLYLIPTRERIDTDLFIPFVTGRSSIGRLGIQCHKEAGLGDIGYHGTLTLQVDVTYPTILYSGDLIAQVYFLTPAGKVNMLYRGKYQDSSGPMESKWRS